ncbi:MAG TPA: hypothetical protein PKL13_01010 [bacterium]|nr:hypothetical protein [bacterium]
MPSLNKKNIIFVLFIIFIFFNFYFVKITYSDAIDTAMLDVHGSAKNLGYDTQSIGLAGTIIPIINMALSFLGIIFLILIIISGLQWMMAGGNEETISKAKNRIKNSIYGLAIILIAYAITWVLYNYIILADI